MKDGELAASWMVRVAGRVWLEASGIDCPDLHTMHVSPDEWDSEDLWTCTDLRYRSERRLWLGTDPLSDLGQGARLAARNACEGALWSEYEALAWRECGALVPSAMWAAIRSAARCAAWFMAIRGENLRPIAAHVLALQPERLRDSQHRAHALLGNAESGVRDDSLNLPLVAPEGENGPVLPNVGLRAHPPLALDAVGLEGVKARRGELSDETRGAEKPRLALSIAEMGGRAR